MPFSRPCKCHVAIKKTRTRPKDCLFPLLNIFADFSYCLKMTNMSDSNNDVVYFYCSGVLMTFFIVLGLLGNIFTIFIFSSPRIWACLNFYIIALAVWDVLLLLSSFFQWSIWCILYRRAVPLFGPHISVLRVAYVCNNTALTGCVWVTVTLTVERYLAILRPLRHRTLNNAYRAKLLLMIVSGGAVLFNIVRVFELEIRTVTILGPNLTFIEIPLLQTSTFRADWLYFLLYRVVGSMVFVYFGPCLILAVLTFRMCVAISKATHTRRSLVQHEKKSCSANNSRRPTNVSMEKTSNVPAEASTNRSSSQSTAQKFSSNNTNKMLAVVLAKFLLCYTLPSITDILEIFMDKKVFYQSTTIEYLILVSNLLVVFNSSCNFFIYVVTGQRFRAEFSRIFHHCWQEVAQFSCTLVSKQQCWAYHLCGKLDQRQKSNSYFEDNLEIPHVSLAPETSLLEVGLSSI